MRIAATIVLLSTISMMLLFTNCRKENITTDPDAQLEFSADTVLFDTVFTTIGTVTKRVKVYNRNNQKVNISSIRLAGGSASNFRLNIDGIPSILQNEIELDAGDSMYIFIEATLDQNNINNPLIIEDYIEFFTNGNEQKVHLMAWGQDAYFHANELVCNETWSNDKPHVIYGVAAVGFPGLDSCCVLTIEAGTQVYLHSGAILYVYKSTIDVNGEFGNRVVFQGDRLEEYYDDIPGQWERIWIQYGKNCQFDYATIKNGNVGIWADTITGNVIKHSEVTIRNSTIQDMAFAGIVAQGAEIDGYNLTVGNCGSYNMALTIGGEYNFTHCTFGNYWNNGSRNTPGFLLNNWYEDFNGVIQKRDIVANFTNCIMYGNKDNEFLVDFETGPILDYTFENCLFKTTEDVSDLTHYINCISNQDPNFVEPFYNNYHLNAGSAADDAGTPSGIGEFTFRDLDNELRNPANPALGCYKLD
jgi:hypothetical protein